MILSTVVFVMGATPLALVGQENWKERLENASEDSAALWAEAERREDVAGLASAVTALEGTALQQRKRLLVRLVPGGDLAHEVGNEVQVQALASLVKASPNQRAVAYKLWRINQLTPNDSLRTAARDALKVIPEEFRPAGSEALFVDASSAPDPAKLARGKEIYMRPGICFTCHQAKGEGIAGAFPPLAGSEWLDDDTDRLIKIVLKGLMGEISVRGESYNSVMAPLEVLLPDDSEVADVLTYVRHEWGSAANADVTTEQVTAIRTALKDRQIPWQVSEILSAHPLGGKK